MKKKAVFVYQDKGASAVGVASLLLAVPEKLGYSACPISAEEIKQGKLAEACALIIPGGADLPYCEQLNGEGNERIKAFVAQGGCYIGICAGAYYGCAEIDFQGEGYVIAGKRELGFFSGVAKGSLAELTSGRFYDEHYQTKVFTPLRFSTGQAETLYYHGGCCFLPYAEHSPASFEILATYPQGETAIVAGKYQQGSYLLSGVHFELQKDCYEQYVCKIAAENDRLFEQRLAQHFSPNYGDTVWKIIAEMLSQS